MVVARDVGGRLRACSMHGFVWDMVGDGDMDRMDMGGRTLRGLAYGLVTVSEQSEGQ